MGVEHNGTWNFDVNHYNGMIGWIPAITPWSHGLFMSVVWSVVAMAIAYLFYRDRRGASIVGLVVFSHWVLDFLVHPHELPLLFYNSPKVGLGLYTVGRGMVIGNFIEIILLIISIVIYLITRRRQRIIADKEKTP